MGKEGETACHPIEVQENDLRQRRKVIEILVPRKMAMEYPETQEKEDKGGREGKIQSEGSPRNRDGK